LYWRNDERSQRCFHVHNEISTILFRVIDEPIKIDAKILDVGCNAGKDLHSLYRLGYRNLTGIDINHRAITLLEKTYPEMAKDVKTYAIPIERVIGELKTNSFDVVYAVATLGHIRNDSAWIFREMARVTSDYLMTIEDEKNRHWGHHPRNYKEIFGKLGMHQVLEVNCNGEKGFNKSHVLRLFRKNVSGGKG